MYKKRREYAGARGAAQTVIYWLLLLGLFSAVTGCGFHPRGSSALPSGMAVTYIKSGKPYGSLAGDFSAALQARGGRVTRLRSEATAILYIVADESERRVLSVNTVGKVLEYETRQTIRFSVQTNDMLPIVEEQEVSMARDYIFSSSEVLSTEREDMTVRKLLQRNLVDLAMLRITAAAR